MDALDRAGTSPSWGACDCTGPMAIGQAAEHFGITVEALRYYEDAALVAPARDASGRRVYGQRNLNALHIVCTMRAAGFGIAEIRELIAVKTDASPEVLVGRARSVLADLQAEVERRQAALRASEGLIRHWQTELDRSGY